MAVIIWSKENCSFCQKAKQLLQEHNLSYEERLLGSNYSITDLLQVVPNAKTVPQIFIDDTYIGGYTDLVNYLE